MVLLEREAVLTALCDHLALAARGQGRLVLLRGEAGAGKTAVLGRFAGRAGSVADVLVGCCDPLSTPRPLGPLVDVAAGLGAAVRRELERANGGPSRVTEVFQCVMDALGVVGGLPFSGQLVSGYITLRPADLGTRRRPLVGLACLPHSGQRTL
jgi:predicted ATPase